MEPILWYLMLVTISLCTKTTYSEYIKDLDSAEILTDKEVYKVGDRIEINCLVHTDKVNLTNVYVKLKYSQGTLKQYDAILMNNTVKLIIPSASVNNSGSYLCYEKQTNGEEISLTITRTICVIDDVKKPKHWECVFVNFDYLKCSWETDLTTFWTLEYKRSEVDETFTKCKNVTKNSAVTSSDGYRCPYKPYGACNGSSYSSCDLGIGSNFFSDTNYTFRLLGCSSVGKKSWEYFVFTGAEIVKLDAVTDLTARSARDEIYLFWNLPYSPDGMDGIECAIYTNGNRNAPRNDSKRLSADIHTQHTRYNITRLPPFTNFTISVRCRPIGSPYWSDKTEVKAHTLPDVPFTGPKFIPGGFSYYPCNRSLCLALYWRDLGEYNSQGKVLGFNINVIDSIKTYTFRNVSAEQQTGLLNMKLENMQTYNILGWSVNEQGQSVNSSHLHISFKTNAAGICLRYTRDNEQKVYNVSYDDQYTSDVHSNVTFYWCQGIRQPSGIVVCQSDLDWTLTNEKSISINTLASDLYFAVSVERNGVNTGMIWKECFVSNILSGYSRKYVIAAVAISVSVVILAAAISAFIKIFHGEVKGYKPEIDIPPVPQSSNCEQLENHIGTTNNNNGNENVEPVTGVDDVAYDTVNSEEQEESSHFLPSSTYIQCNGFIPGQYGYLESVDNEERRIIQNGDTNDEYTLHETIPKVIHSEATDNGETNNEYTLHETIFKVIHSEATDTQGASCNDFHHPSETEEAGSSFDMHSTHNEQRHCEHYDSRTNDGYLPHEDLLPEMQTEVNDKHTNGTQRIVCCRRGQRDGDNTDYFVIAYDDEQDASSNYVPHCSENEESIRCSNLQLTDNGVQLTDSEVQSTDNEVQLTDNEVQLTDDEVQLTDNEVQLTDNEVQLTDNEVQLTDNEVQLTDNDVQLTDNEVQLTDNEKPYEHNPEINTESVPLEEIHHMNQNEAADEQHIQRNDEYVQVYVDGDVMCHF